MNKPLIYTLLTGSLGIFLAGCGDKSIDSTDSSDVDSPVVSFSPFSAEPVLSTPNDLLLASDISDLTTYGRLAGIPDQDVADVYAATAQMDGWGLTTPFTILVELPRQEKFMTSLRSASVEQEGAVYIFKCPKGESIAAGACTNPLNITPLSYGVDFSLTATDDGIQVTPLKPLEPNTGYFLGVTTMPEDNLGQAVTRSVTFDTYSTGTGTGSADEIALNAILSGTNALLSGLTGLSSDDFTYSATWTTQDVETVAILAMDEIVSTDRAITFADTGITARDVLALQGVTYDNASQEAFILDNMEVWGGTLDLPYFLPYPGLGLSDATYPTCAFSVLCGNWLDSSGQSPWKGSTDLDIPASALSPGSVDVIVIIPNETLTTALTISEVKIAQYVHGVTSVKETAYALALAAGSQGFAIVAIDHPLHGSRSFDDGSGGAYELTATSSSYGVEYENGDSAVFANLGSLLTGRDNLRQAASDQLSLRWAISNSDLTAANSNVVEEDISLVGVSLGSIVGTVAQGMSEIYTAEDLTFNASALSVGGAQIGPILGYSDYFGSITQDALISTTSFSGGVAAPLGYTQQEALTLQAATGTEAEGGYGDAAQTALGGITSVQAQGAYGGTQDQALIQYNGFVKLGYPGFLQAFINGAQAIIDSGDSSIWATITTDTPTLAHQVIGSETSLSDQVIPNETTSDGYPLGGTNGWVNALGLAQASSSSVNAGGLRVFVNFTEGEHGSALDPTSSLAATTEMQTQILGFLATAGTALVVTDTTVVE